jgi:hypothetical protein
MVVRQLRLAANVEKAGAETPENLGLSASPRLTIRNRGSLGPAVGQFVCAARDPQLDAQQRIAFLPAVNGTFGHHGFQNPTAPLHY